MRKIITQEQGFSGSLHDSFTIITNNGYSVSIQSNHGIRPQQTVQQNISIQQQKVQTKNYQDFLPKNPQSLYSFSPLYINNHAEDYTELSHSFSNRKFSLSILRERDESSILLEKSGDFQANQESNGKTQIIDIRKVSLEDVKEKFLKKVYCMGSLINQGNYPLMMLSSKTLGPDRSIRNTIWDIKPSDNIFKLIRPQNTKPFTQELLNSKEDQKNLTLVTKLHKTSLSFETIKKYPSQIQFYSNFQSGNLYSVYQSLLLPQTYFLYLRNDTNTNGYTQWFNFYIKNQTNSFETSSARFFIMNISKKIIFREGMKLLTKINDKRKSIHVNNRREASTNHSRLKFEIQESPELWRRQVDFSFYESKQTKIDGTNFMIIDFTLSQELLNKGVNVALAYPYSYSRINRLLKDVSNTAFLEGIPEDKLRIKSIGESVLGINILVIEFNRKEEERVESPTKSRPQTKSILKIKRPQKYLKVVVLARQHPSQTVGSFICEFLIKRLVMNFLKQTKNSFEKMATFDKYQWYIIPVVNPDGVIHGNSRTNIKGYDVNRCWSRNTLSNSSEAQCISKYLQNLKLAPDDIIIDLHGHGRQFGIFTYNSEMNPKIQQFNGYMAQLCPYFCLSKCTYKVDASKKDTFRAQMAQKYKIKNCITIETSMYGFEVVSDEAADKTKKKLYPYQEEDFNLIAASILKSLDYLALSSQQQATAVFQNKQTVFSTEKQPEILKEIMGATSYSKTILIVEGYQEQKQNEVSNEDSDSNPEGEYLQDIQRKQLQNDKQQPKISYTQYPKQKRYLSQPVKPRKKKEQPQKFNPPDQKMSFINLSELENLRKSTEASKTKSKFNKFIETSKKQKKQNAKEKNSRRFNSECNLSIEQPSKIKHKPLVELPGSNKSNKHCQSYFTRKTFRNLYNVASDRSAPKTSGRKNVLDNNNTLFNDKHLSLDKKVVKNPNLLVQSDKKITLQPKTVIMQDKEFPHQSSNEKLFTPHQFLQSTTNINWKLRAKVQSDGDIGKQKIREAQKKSNQIFDIKEIANLEKTTKLLQNLQKAKHLSNPFNPKGLLEEKLRRLNFNSNKVSVLPSKNKF